MEYEGKNKIFYIGTVVLFVIFILLYAVYFFVDHPDNNKKRTTTDSIQVNTSNVQEEISINGELIAKEISSEIAMISVIKEEEPIVEEPTPVVTPKRSVVRRNNTYVLAVNQEQAVQEEQVEVPAPAPVQEENNDMKDVIIEETHEESTPVVTPEVSEPIVGELEESNEE